MIAVNKHVGTISTEISSSNSGPIRNADSSLYSALCKRMKLQRTKRSNS